VTSTPPNQRPDKLTGLPFVIGGLSFIPLIGVTFGIAAIVWALSTRKPGRLKLGLIGAGGIAFTLVLYGGLLFFGFVQRSGIYDRLRVELARGQLYTLVQAVEFYNLQYGSYPETLKQLQDTLPHNSFVSVFDPTVSGFGMQPRLYYYERKGTDHYYLLGVGPDGEPFTEDDILPEIEIPPNSRIGLLLNAPPGGVTPASR
jgi:hypothetical protein